MVISGYMTISWLVVAPTPLKKYDFVIWNDELVIPCMEKEKSCWPPTSLNGGIDQNVAAPSAAMEQVT